MFILRMIDILGPELKLKIRQKDTYKTKIGGFFTLIFVLLVSLATKNVTKRQKNANKIYDVITSKK